MRLCSCLAALSPWPGLCLGAGPLHWLHCASATRQAGGLQARLRLVTLQRCAGGGGALHTPQVVAPGPGAEQQLVVQLLVDLTPGTGPQPVPGSEGDVRGAPGSGSAKTAVRDFRLLQAHVTMIASI